MKNSPTLKPVIAFALAALIVVSCGSSSETAAEITPTTGPEPTATEVVKPTAVPRAQPPTPEPTAVPTMVPTEVPTVEPTAVPSSTTEPTATVVPTAEPTIEPTEAPTEEPTPAALTLPADAGGATVFAAACARCHGSGGSGTSQGPPLTGIGQFFTDDTSPLARLVTNGGTDMPAFGSRLTPEQIVAVADYVAATFQ